MSKDNKKSVCTHLNKYVILTLICIMALMLVLVVFLINNKEIKVFSTMKNSFLAETTVKNVGTNVNAEFNSTTEELKLYSTSGIGTIDLYTLKLFYTECGINNIKTITLTNEIYAAEDSQYQFYDLPALTTFNNANYLNMEKVENAQAMFYECKNLTNIDVSNWNVSNVTDFSYMFYKCNNLTELNLSNWNVSNVIHFQVCLLIVIT